MKRIEFEGKVHEFPDDFTDQDIARALSLASGKTQAPVRANPATRALSMAEGAAGALPSALGFLGGRLGTPFGGPWVGSPVGAAIGGGIGEAAREGLLGRSLDPKAIIASGAGQGASEFGGQGLVSLGKKAGRVFMQGALRPILKLSRAHPEVVESALESGATVGRVPGMGGGLASAEAKRKAAGNATRTMLSRAGVARFRLFPLMPKLDEVVSAQSPMLKEEREQASKIIRDFLKNHPAAKNPEELKAMKDELWERARTIFPKLEEGSLVKSNSPSLPVEARVYYAAAKNIQKALESIPEHMTGKPAAVAGISPRAGMRGVRAQEDVTRRLIGVAKGVKRAEDIAKSGVSRFVPQGFGRGSLAATGGAIGASRGESGSERVKYGIEGAIAGTLLSQPEVMSRLAHIANNPALLALARQSPRMLAFLLFGPEGPADTTAATPR